MICRVECILQDARRRDGQRSHAVAIHASRGQRIDYKSRVALLNSALCPIKCILSIEMPVARWHDDQRWKWSSAIRLEHHALTPRSSLLRLVRKPQVWIV